MLSSVKFILPFTFLVNWKQPAQDNISAHPRPLGRPALDWQGLHHNHIFMEFINCTFSQWSVLLFKLLHLMIVLHIFLKECISSQQRFFLSDVFFSFSSAAKNGCSPKLRTAPDLFTRYHRQISFASKFILMVHFLTLANHL